MRKECISTVDLNLQTFSLKSKHILIKTILIILTAALVLTGVTPSFATDKLTPSAEINWEDGPELSGTSAIMIDAGSGEILYEKNAYERRDPASVTKILTCLTALETLNLNDNVTIDYDVETIGHVLDLKQGETISVKDLFYGLMVYSANDVAEVLAIEAGGSIENFCDMMNERAKKCGAEGTTFTNPNGLNSYGQENHKTTAYDIAMITKEAMKNKTFRKLVSTVSYTIPATNKSGERKLKSTNLCLYQDKKTVEINGEKRPFKYEGTLGVKTGSTGTAGECFCGMARRQGTELIAVTLNAEDPDQRFADVMKLWDYGFSKYYTYNAARGNTELDDIKVKRGEKRKVALGIAEDLDITLNKGYNAKDITVKVVKDKRKVMAPVKKGQVLGSVTVYKDKKLVAKADLFALENASKGGILSYIGIADEHVPKFLISLLIVLIILIVIRMLYIRHKRIQRQRRKAQRQRNLRRREWEREKDPFDKR